MRRDDAPAAGDAAARTASAEAVMAETASADGVGARSVRSLRRALLGTDVLTRRALRFTLVVLIQNLIWTLILFRAGVSGRVDLDVVRLLVIFSLAGPVMFYLCLRLGWTVHLKDSGLVAPQMLWTSLAATLAFALAPLMRPAMLQSLCVIQVWGFFYLRPRQLVVTGGGAALMLTAALAIGAAGGLPGFESRREVYPALLSLVVLVSIVALTIDHSMRRDRLNAGKQQLNTAMAAVRDMVIRDSLTGLPNRRHMQELLQIEQARAQQNGLGFAVALIDLDHFKRINDSHGHATGDEVLRQFAERAQTSIRRCDTIARWGGEEFLVLMPETAPEPEAVSPFERLRADLRQQPDNSTLARVGLTFSAGIAFHHPGEPVAQALADADRALYTAKAAGRNRDLFAA